MPDLNKNIITSLLRHLLGCVGAYLVGKGLLTNDQTTQIIGVAVAILGPLTWSIIEKYLGDSKFFQLIKAALQLPADPTREEIKTAFANPPPVTAIEKEEIKEAVAGLP